VGFVSRPCTDSAKVITIQLHKLVPLCRTASHTPGVGQEQTNGLATKAIKRIELCLARRTNAEKVVFVVALWWLRVKANTDCFSAIRRHFQVSSNRQFNNGPILAVEWHACADTTPAAPVRLVKTTGGRLKFGCRLRLFHSLDLSYAVLSEEPAPGSCHALHTLNLTGTQVFDVSALASCQSLHTLKLARTQVCDISALASCQALHTLDLFLSKVRDISPLASCQALHTLSLYTTQVNDVSALASCQALHTLTLSCTPVRDVSALAACGSLRYLHGCEHMLGYGAIARLLKARRR
jgi:hypothetical protein